MPRPAPAVAGSCAPGSNRLVLADNFATLDVGSDLVSPVSPRYACPFAFTGRIESVAIDLLEDR